MTQARQEAHVYISTSFKLAESELRSFQNNVRLIFSFWMSGRWLFSGDFENMVIYLRRCLSFVQRHKKSQESMCICLKRWSNIWVNYFEYAENDFGKDSNDAVTDCAWSNWMYFINFSTVCSVFEVWASCMQLRAVQSDCVSFKIGLVEINL